ncbi:MAG: quinone-dependent dihydroorotate dehydrogenase [Ktedonobacterales bacterium]|nr:quinone-dependent dihydroorotate dehydrogenase [Ktedonobacterales bacterium]
MLYQRAIRPALFRLGGDPEAAHERVLGWLARISRSEGLTRALALAFGHAAARGPEREVFGLRFPHPIGLAAGFDKNGVAVPALAALGFSFIEVGTVTRDPQPGNPRPRLFRLPEEGALINRMGFNNQGAAVVAARLARQRPVGIPIGISLGKSKRAPLEEAVADYLAALELLYTAGDYFAVNVSSPNTPDLRALQAHDRLDALVAALVARLRARAAAEGRAAPKPLLVKVAPDLDEPALDAVVAVCLARGASGLIAVNTTVSRAGLGAGVPPTLAAEAGGLSGRPLHAQALGVVRALSRRAGTRLPIIGCGGIATPDDARRMLDAGATLLQLYTGFIYEGPGIARRLATALSPAPPT